MNGPEIDYGNGDEARNIKVRAFQGRVQLRWDEPNSGFSLTPTQARQLAGSLRRHADRAQKEHKQILRQSL